MGNVLRRMSMEIPAVQEADTSSVEFAKKVQDELGYSRLLVAVRTPPAKPLLKARMSKLTRKVKSTLECGQEQKKS